MLAKGIQLSVIFLALLLPVHSNGAEGELKLEVYLYLNGDNDLITIKEDLKTIHQAEEVFEQFRKIAEQISDETAFHIYFDPNSEFRGGSGIATQNSSDSKITNWWRRIPGSKQTAQISPTSIDSLIRVTLLKRLTKIS